jgi:immune inhibitor A
MKRAKRLIIMLIFMAIAVNSWGAKAYTGPVVITQTDGTTLTIFGHGDENLHWYTTSDGVFVVQEGFNYYIASIDTNGNLSASTQIAHEKGNRSAIEEALVNAQNKDAFYKAIPTATRMGAITRSIGTGNPPYFPHTGTPKALVILVQFTDTVFKSSDPKATFNYYLNAKAGDAAPSDNDIYQTRNYGSVAQYFSDMSQGTYIPQFDVVGPVTLDTTSLYYGKNDNISALVKNACTKVDKDVDFSKYDADGDNYVDLVYIIYAGYGSSVSGDDNDIWPQSGTTNGGTYDNVKVSRFGVNNELNYWPTKKFSSAPYHRINGIGLFCHEFSHTLGLPDLYSRLAVDNQELEYWDLMDGGEYTDNGYRPTPYSPWEMEEMGWMNYNELTDTAQYSLKPFDEERKAYKIASDVSGNNEYLLLQNIQNNGWWGKLLGHGMLVYRIDYKSTTVNLGDFPNGTSGKPGITIVPADSLLISSYRVFSSKSDSTSTTPYSSTRYFNSMYGDPYPGTKNVLEIDSVTMNSCIIKKPIYNINETTDGTIYFDFLKNIATTDISNINIEEKKTTDLRIYSINGIYLGTDESALPRGIYIRNHKKIIIK